MFLAVFNCRKLEKLWQGQEPYPGRKIDFVVILEVTNVSTVRNCGAGIKLTRVIVVKFNFFPNAPHVLWTSWSSLLSKAEV